MTVGNRIKRVRKEAGLTQQAFADRIGLKQNTIATYEIGATTPGDRTINDICREFRVSRDWLISGVGGMYLPRSRNAEIGEYLGKIMADEDAEFQRRIIAAMAKIPPEAWPGIEKFIQHLVGDEEKG